MPPNGRKRQKSDKKINKEIIHSGHFMVSDIDDPEVQDGEENPSLAVHESDCDQETIPLPERRYDFESVCKETSKTYTFGTRSSSSISIDVSLTKLFECMSLAYSGKLTSPRWKQFKGLKLRLKEKIRLNNIIWRAWHMQFVMKMKTSICQFATPLDGDTHMKPEAVVVEGTYWKRKTQNITEEYKKWRSFFRDKHRPIQHSEIENMAIDMDARWPSWTKDSSLQNSMDEDFIMDFSDTLFSTFNPNQPFDFPNPREIAAKAGIADFIQPGLVQLQPSVDDFMDTLEPLADLFTDFLTSKLPTLPEENTEISSNLSDITSDQQAYFGLNTKSFGVSVPDNVSLESGVQLSVPSSIKRNNNIRKSLPSQSFHQVEMPSSTFSQKNLLENINCSANNETLLQKTVPSLTANQLPLQSFMCNTSIINQPLQNTSIEKSLTQENFINRITSALPLQENNTVVMQDLLQQNKKEPLKHFIQQSSFLQKPYNALELSQNHLINSPNIHVPLQSILQGHIAENISSNVNNNETKHNKHPLFFSASLNQPNQNLNQLKTTGNFKLPVPMSNHPATEGNIPLLSSIGKSLSMPPITTTESSTFRRHSYTTGQHVYSPIQNSGDYISSRRSRPIAPANIVGNFAIPEVPSKQRTRSRSVSSPQAGSPKSFLQPPSQAVSLTDISSPLQTVIVQETNKNSIISDPSLLVGHTPTVTNSNVLPQNAVLAQILSSGIKQQETGQTIIKVTTTTSPSVTTPITIIRPLVNTTAHTFVFSPVPIASPSGVNDLHRSLLFNNNSPPCILPSPDSPGSSTCSSSPAIPAISFENSITPTKGVKLKSDEEKSQHKEHRRVCHINAEQKRRCNIKNGFESLHNLLPNLGQTPNAKISKAAMLQRGADYIRTLKIERQQQQEEAERLKKQIDELNQTISMYQSQLPASGAPVPCQRTNKMKEMFEEYVKQQTLQNWKFWIFSLILEPLVESYNNNISTANVDEMCKSILTWLEQHCSLVALRPGVLNSLRYLSTTTNILTDPSCMPEEATRAVTKKETRQ